ncbi:hypothetical protein AAV99_00445 [Aurantiacibacter marinus]|uniref:Uncharacterized protein n=1 Tax=Aurantiacibacter marinus TaxID=874156 RepID=A0A0H0XQ93_9SPHN|nr:hypothetical protein [Aurantiacibacter marinus]KLI64186.1 hypothetical protein AAV99_00445 [Aurantiacibacter marinus]
MQAPHCDGHEWDKRCKKPDCIDGKPGHEDQAEALSRVGAAIVHFTPKHFSKDQCIDREGGNPVQQLEQPEFLAPRTPLEISIAFERQDHPSCIDIAPFAEGTKTGKEKGANCPLPD